MSVNRNANNLEPSSPDSGVEACAPESATMRRCYRQPLAANESRLFQQPVGEFAAQGKFLVNHLIGTRLKPTGEPIRAELLRGRAAVARFLRVAH
jgi:hypothetical protein